MRTLGGNRGPRGRAAGPIGSPRPATSIQVPSTVQAILAARIDRLAPEDKQLLQAAAVIGKDVPYPLLQAWPSCPRRRCASAWRRLQAAEFLYEKSAVSRPGVHLQARAHPRSRVWSVLQERRKALHARIMASVEQLYADRVTEQLERLAHHALRGEVWDKALAYLVVFR